MSVAISPDLRRLRGAVRPRLGLARQGAARASTMPRDVAGSRAAVLARVPLRRAVRVRGLERGELQCN